jgi:hypothetical protein
VDAELGRHAAADLRSVPDQKTDIEIAQERILFNELKRRYLRQPGRRKRDLPIPPSIRRLSPAQQTRYFAWKAKELLRDVFGVQHADDDEWPPRKAAQNPHARG